MIFSPAAQKVNYLGPKAPKKFCGFGSSDQNPEKFLTKYQDSGLPDQDHVQDSPQIKNKYLLSN